jgi:hypothetical protein
MKALSNLLKALFIFTRAEWRNEIELCAVRCNFCEEGNLARHETEMMLFHSYLHPSFVPKSKYPDNIYPIKILSNI